MRSSLLVAPLCLLLTAQAARATSTFNLLFDNNYGLSATGTVTPPYIGSGTFYTPDTLSTGKKALSSLSSWTLSITIAGDTFTASSTSQNNLLTNPTAVNLVITSTGYIHNLQFTSDWNGPYYGNLDLAIGTAGSGTEVAFTMLPDSTQSYQFIDNGAGAAAGTFYFGNYTAIDVPEPGSMAVVAAAAGALALVRRRTRMG